MKLSISNMFAFSGYSFSSPTMEGRGVLVHIGYEPVHVHYLERPFIAAFPNVQLVSDEGAVFRLNSALLASSSPKLKSLLSDADSSEPFTTIHTEIGKKHLSIFCQFVTTGTLPMAGDGGLDNPSGAPLSPDTVESFRHLGVNLRELRLTPTLSPVNVKVEFNPDEKSGVPDGIFEMVIRNGHKPTTHDDLFDDVFSGLATDASFLQFFFVYVSYLYELSLESKLNPSVTFMSLYCPRKGWTTPFP